MKKKSRFVSLCAALALTTTLAACGGGDNGNESAAPSGSGESGQQDIKLKFVSWWSYLKPEHLQVFEEENPGIRIDYEYVPPGDSYFNKIKALSASNELPDVFATQDANFDSLAKAGEILDLTEALGTPAYDKEASWRDTINPVLMSSLANQLSAEADAANHAWGVPFGAVSVVVVYNKTMFDELGISAPTTWEQFEQNNEKIKAAGNIPMSFNGKLGWNKWWYEYLLDQTIRDVKPEDYASGAAKLTDPGVVEAFDKIKQMWDDGVFDPGGFTNGPEETQALFVQQKLAQYMVVPENFVKYLTENMPEGIEIGAYALPGYKGLTPNRAIGGASNVAVVSAKSKHQEAAIKFAKFLTSEKLYQLLSSENVVPSTIGYQPPEGDLIMGAFAEAIEGGFTEPHIPSGPVSEQALKDAMAQILLNNVPTADALAEAQKKIDK
ncbi:ABC transporter substrate-binding protein [Cohnella hongkongensis]|uniref:ABC transporter substrate-binding protein n=1 Tax=Cohnella hongkongensis TaxID=178337 RepID=A0ABV9F6G1_9BACL